MISKIFKRSTNFSYFLKLNRAFLPHLRAFTEVAAPAEKSRPKVSPFHNYKEYETKKSYEKTEAETIKKMALDEILGNYTSLVNPIVMNPKFIEKFDKEAMLAIINHMWSCYIGMKKIISGFHKINVPHANPDIFISSNFLKSPKIMNNLEFIISRISAYFEVHQEELQGHVLLVSQAMKAFTKHEKFHENQKYWEVLYKIIGNYLDTVNENTDPKVLNPMLSFAKNLSIRRHYIKHFAKFPSQKELDQLQALESKILEITDKYSSKISIRGLISLLVQYKLNQDPLLEDMSKRVSKRLKMPAENQEIAKCYVKLHKLKADPVIGVLAKDTKRILHQNAVFNNLKTPEIGLIFWSLQYDPDEITGSEFSAFWNNFYHNVKFKTPLDFNLFDISTMIKSVMNCRYNTQARFSFLQEAAELALENYNQQIIKEENHSKEEEDEEEAEAQDEDIRSTKMTLNLFISTSIHLLINLSIKPLSELNLRLVEKLLRVLKDNQSKIFYPNVSTLLLSCGRFKLKLDKSPEIAKENEKFLKFIQDFGKQLSNFFIEKYNFMKSQDIARALYSLIVLGNMTPELFQKMTTSMLSRSNTFNHISYITLLQLISEIAEFPALYTSELIAFEEVMVNRLASLVQEEKKDIYVAVVTGFPNMKNIRSFYILGSSLESQLSDRIKYLSMKDLGHVIMIFTTNKFISLKTLDESIGIIKEKAQYAQLKDFSALVLAFRTAAAGNIEFFQSLEDLILKKLNKLMSGSSNDHSQPHETVMIFNELCKLRIFNRELIQAFEKFISLNGYSFNITVLFHTLNSLLQYKTDNVVLLESLVTAMDKFLEYDDLEFKQRNLGFSFMHHVFCIKLEYGNKIDLRKYKNIMRVFEKLEPLLPSLRKKYPLSTFQTGMRENLQYARYEFIEEYPISIYNVDFFIKPNIVIEADGENHFIPKTDIPTWPTLKKKRQLEKLGYKVINIPYFEWQKLDSSQVFKYLKEKIGF